MKYPRVPDFIPDMRDATPEEFIAWMRADAAARDAVIDRGNRAFDEAFRQTMRRGRK